MREKRVLLLHISQVSGHYCASVAIEKALHNLDPSVQTKNIDAFNYTNPLLEKVVNRLYMFVIEAWPQFWEYLYDNQDVLRRIRKTRALLHKLCDKKVQRLFEQFTPDIVVCTQAFPCGMVADYKRRHKINIPLVGVLTDYAPHSYWLNDSVDIYVVPAAEIKQGLIKKGISAQRLKILGIPIEPKFNQQREPKQTLRSLELDEHLPVILIMGGGQGLGPIKGIVKTLDGLSASVQLAVVCGRNKALYKWLNKSKFQFNKPVSVFGYTQRIDELMAVSCLVVTKPGGLTSAEALSKSLPIIIVKPLPGQESLNSAFLLEKRVALQVEEFGQLKSLVEGLLSDRARLTQLRRQAAAFSSPDATEKIAQLILSMSANTKN